MDKDLKKLISETIEKTLAEAPEKLIERGIHEIQYDICPHCRRGIYENHEYTEDGGTTWRHSDCKGLIARSETPSEKINGWLRPYVVEAKNQRNAARTELGTKKNVTVYNPYVGSKTYSNMTPKKAMDAFYKENGVTKGKQIIPKYTTYTSKNENAVGLPSNGEARKELDYDNDLGAYEPLAKDNPSSTMMAVNVDEGGTPSKSLHGMSETRAAESEESKLVGARGYARFANNMMNFVNASNIPLKATVTEISVMADQVHSVKTYIVKVDNG